MKFLHDLPIVNASSLPLCNNLDRRSILRMTPLPNDEEHLFLSELGNAPDPSKWYNDFAIDQCCWLRDNAHNNRLMLGASLVMKEVCREIEMELYITDKKEGRSYQAELQRGVNTALLSCRTELTVPDDCSRFVFMARARWTDVSGCTHEVVVSEHQILNSGDVYVREYRHAWPKKEKEALFFNPDESSTQAPVYERGEIPCPAFDPSDPSSYVCIALKRKPDDLKDCDYVCYKENKPLPAGNPHICIPLYGTLKLKFPNRFETFLPSSTCMLIKKPISDNGIQTGSGVKFLASGGTSYQGKGFAHLFDNDKGDCTYWLTTKWEDILNEQGDMAKTYYDIRIELHFKLEKMQEEAVMTATSIRSFTCMRNTLLPIALMWGCLAEDTLIRMADGSCRRIKDIRIGDRVWVDAGRTQAQVTNVWTGYEEELVKVTCANGRSLSMTPQHPVRVSGGVKRPVNLAIGDLMVSEEGCEIAVTSIETITYSKRVYNLDLEGDGAKGMFMSAEGFVVGDFSIQNSHIN